MVQWFQRAGFGSHIHVLGPSDWALRAHRKIAMHMDVQVP